MIAIKKKGIFIIFFIIFLINIFLIAKRRDFNFYNLKSFFYPSQLSLIKKDLNLVKNENNNYEYNNIFNFLKENKIKEINIDTDLLKKTNNIGDIIFYFYPIKFNDKSQYVIGYHDQIKYNGCSSLLSKPKNADNKFWKDKLTVYICE